MRETATAAAADRETVPRWIAVWHLLFAVTLVLPLGFSAASLTLREWLAALAVCVVFAAWYWWWVVGHPHWWERDWRILAYFAGAAGFSYVLTGISGEFYLLLYSLYPQAFVLLGWVGGVVGSVAISLAWLWRSGQFGDPDVGVALSLVGATVLGVAIGLVLDALEKQNARRREAIEALDAARAEVTAALSERSTLYEALQALAVARDPLGVCRALGERLALPGVERVLLLSYREPGQGWLPVEASWQAPGVRPLPRGLRLRTDPPPPGELAVPRGAELPAGEQEVWTSLGLAAAALVTLPGGGDVVAFTRSVPAGGWPAEDTRRMILEAAPSAGLVLENQRLLARARLTGVLEERQRLAQELHDTLAQGLASIVVHLEAAEGAVGAAGSPALDHMDRARTAARDSLGEVRRTVQALRPQVLEGTTLAEALTRVVARWSAESGVAAVTAVTGTPRALHPDVDVALLRVAQEALANVRKHAAAEHVTVTLSYMDDVVTVDVDDDGVGFDPAAAAEGGGYGLIAMRQRCARLGGDVAVESTPGAGTTVAARVPLDGGEGESR